VKLVQQVGGRDQDAGDAIGRGCDLLGAQYADGAFDHHHDRKVLAARGVEERERLEHVVLRFHVGEKHRVGADRGDRLHVIVAPRRVEVVHAHHDFAPPVAAGEHRLDHVAARLLLFLDQDRIAQVEDHAVHPQRARLVQIARVAAGNIQHGAPRAKVGVHP
jgi:hypothetical protein